MTHIKKYLGLSHALSEGNQDNALPVSFGRDTRLKVKLKLLTPCNMSTHVSAWSWQVPNKKHGFSRLFQ